MSFFKPISISLSPNTEKDDVRLAFKLKFQPWKWETGKEIEELENEFKNYLGVKYAISFNSGRSALMAILNSLGLEKGSEVLLQAFTCNAAANPIIWAGLKPVYVDCNEKTFNIDIEDLKRKITPKSKAVMVQHTFGLPAEMDEILEICQEGEEDKSSSSPLAEARGNNLILIEDCAHSLGATYGGKKVGTFGKVAFFSFSRDKVISSVYGGMAVTDDDNLAGIIKKNRLSAEFLDFSAIIASDPDELADSADLQIIGKISFSFISMASYFIKSRSLERKKRQKTLLFSQKITQCFGSFSPKPI